MSWDIAVELNGFRFENASWNYTHNCNNMMRVANFDWVYNLDGALVKDTIPKFQEMVKNLKADPERYIAMNPANGWGSYYSLVKLWETEILPRAIEISEAIPEVTWYESS